LVTDMYIGNRNIGTHCQHRWIGVSGLPIPFWRTNYGRCCTCDC